MPFFKAKRKEDLGFGIAVSPHSRQLALREAGGIFGHNSGLIGLEMRYLFAEVGKPNIMIKVPGTAEGYEAIRRLTAKGIPTNNTVSLVMAQFVACMDAVARGLREARARPGEGPPRGPSF